MPAEFSIKIITYILYQTKPVYSRWRFENYIPEYNFWIVCYTQRIISGSHGFARSRNPVLCLQNRSWQVASCLLEKKTRPVRSSRCYPCRMTHLEKAISRGYSSLFYVIFYAKYVIFEETNDYSWKKKFEIWQNLRQCGCQALTRSRTGPGLLEPFLQQCGPTSLGQCRHNMGPMLLALDQPSQQHRIEEVLHKPLLNVGREL